MKSYSLVFLFLCLGQVGLYAQSFSSNSHGHSHNDYLQNQPFYYAHQHGFGSIEADVFLIDGELYVAHDKEEISLDRTLKNLYLEPILEQFKQNNGRVYLDEERLQLLIDLKTDGEPTLRALEKTLRPYRNYFNLKDNPNAVQIIISGSMPNPDRFHLFDDIFYFDGRSANHYSDEQLKRVPIFSAPLNFFTKWDGLGEAPEADYKKVKSFVDSVHRLEKKVRFWGTPDTKPLWQSFLRMGVDYINTDSPAELTAFLRSYE
jgi:alkaline phosphatase